MLNLLSRHFEFDIEHFDIHDEHIMDFSSFNRIIQSSMKT